MPNFFNNLDGTGRPLRDMQRVALKWLQDEWSNHRIFCLNLPVGSGKSLLARTIQLECGGSIIPPSNVLLRQYAEMYPHVNTLLGKAHYPCPESITCADHTTVFKRKPCPGCPYSFARERALMGTPTIFNPASLLHLKGGKFSRGAVTVIDEAHSIAGFLCSMTGRSFDYKKYPFTPQCVNEIYLIDWMKDQQKKLEKLLSLYITKGKNKEAVEVHEEIESFKLVLQGLEEDSENYAVDIIEKLDRGTVRRCLQVRPIRPPRFIVNSLLGEGKVVLMSGTLFESDIKDLIGDEAYGYLDLPSPIPVANRRIRYRPMAEAVNKDTDPRQIATAIQGITAMHPNENTIVHLSYAASKVVSPCLDIPILNNDKKTKEAMLEQFKAKGGVFIAAGCAEGLDLKGDLCRINIVPKMLFPNLGDMTVMKRRSQPDGELWYALQTLKTTIQQLGRSTRTETDFSIGYVLDPQFARLVMKYRKYLPKSFIESIQWTC